MVKLSDIRALVDVLARSLRPQRIILFGSYAYGKPTADSDVDLLVIMPGRKSPSPSTVALPADRTYALDLLIKSAAYVEKRVSQNDFFLMEILEKGKVLYEAPHAGVGAESRRRLRQRRSRTPRPQAA